MDGTQLTALINERHEILTRLLELGNRQLGVIAAGRMSELMRLLAEKQAPLQRLGQISKELQTTAGEDPAQRAWPSPDAREQCRQAQDECERMHIDLLAIEAQCETALNECRSSAQQELDQFDASRRAANQYAHTQTTPTSGARLDLSSD